MGFWLAVAGSVLVVAALFFHRRAYKPLHAPLPARRASVA
jgi:hypothetical protein